MAVHRIGSSLAYTPDENRGGPGVLVRTAPYYDGVKTWKSLASGAAVTVSNIFKNKREQVTATLNLNSALATTGIPFFIANGKSYSVESIEEVHTVAEATGGTANLKVERCQGTEAAAAGDDLLAITDTDLKAAANTVIAGTVITAAGINVLAAGDRLVAHAALDDANAVATTEYVGQVTVKLLGVADGIEADKEGVLFTSVGRTFDLVNVEAHWSTAESTAAQCNLLVERLQGVEAPGAASGGAGNRLVGLTDMDVTGTADTVGAGTVVTASDVNQITSGDRIAFLFADDAGTTTVVPTELDGLNITLYLVPRTLESAATT